MTVDVRLVLLSVVVFGGLVTWTMFSDPSDAGGQATAPSSPVLTIASLPDPAVTPTAATPVTPAEETSLAAIAPTGTAPVDGLKISSQSWRRGGLGSKALVTFTLRNRNDYAVRDIEIFCAFARQDGSHLTDRRRTIHDTVNMRSRRTFARMLVGFVNIRANRAKCSLVTATRA